MGFVIVVAIAATVGVLVYRLTGGDEVVSRDAPEDASGFASPIASPVASAGSSPGSEAPSDVQEWAGGDVDLPSRAAAAAEGPRRVELSAEAGSIPVVSTRQSWHSRLNGAMGLILAVGLGAIAIAAALYLGGTMIARLVSNSG